MTGSLQFQKVEKSYLKSLLNEYKKHYEAKINPDTGKNWPRTRVTNASYRKVGREILKMLYFEAQRLHEGWEKSAYSTSIF